MPTRSVKRPAELQISGHNTSDDYILPTPERFNARYDSGPRPARPARAHVRAAAGEFAGTFFFLLLAYGGTIQSVAQAPLKGPRDSVAQTTILSIAFSYAFPLMINAWAMSNISGSHFNPAVTLATVVAGNTAIVRAVIMVAAQVLGSIAAGLAAEVLFPGDVAVNNTAPGLGVSTVQALFMEFFFTTQLALVALTVGGCAQKGPVATAIGVGFSVGASILAGGGYSGASLNPVRSLGCAVGSRTFHHTHWIYWLGPLAGGLLAAAFYRTVNILQDEKDDKTDYDASV